MNHKGKMLISVIKNQQHLNYANSSNTNLDNINFDINERITAVALEIIQKIADVVAQEKEVEAD